MNMKIFGVWFAYIVIGMALFAGFIKYIGSDEYSIKSAVPVTVIKLMQEDNRSSTHYRGVFLLENGKYIDFLITPSTFVTTHVGDKLSFNLNKYETGEAPNAEAHRFKIVMTMIVYVLLLVGYVFCAGAGCIDLTTYIKKHPKAKLRLHK